MAKSASFFELGFVRLNRRKNEPLSRQLYDSLQAAILSGQLRKGYRLPSTRALAEQLGVSRTTVINAFDQLTAEGYLRGNVGKGTYVSDELPEETSLVKYCRTGDNSKKEKLPIAPAEQLVSKRGSQFIEAKAMSGRLEDLRPFRAGIPALDEFPIEVWSKLLRKRWRKVGLKDLSYGRSEGCVQLQEAIAEYVRGYRGVHCDSEQVMIVSGTQQAVDIVNRLVLDQGDEVLFENPGYLRARSAFESAGAKVIPVPVDGNGMDIEYGFEKSPNARLVYVTPSHQFPLGVTMPIERRMALIEWTNNSGALIFEDDYDSEYRYSQRPIPALQGLDRSGRTIYVGSFSKVVFPSLGIGYAIVPHGLVEGFKKVLGLVGRPVSQIDQLILADFIKEGHFARHLRKMRIVHEQRRTALVESIETYFPDKLEIVGADAGLHATARIRTNACDRDVCRLAAEKGVVLKPLSEYDLNANSRQKAENGLIFGFACSTPRQIKLAVRKLTEVI